MTNPVAPVEGHYALLRKGSVALIGERKNTPEGVFMFHSAHFNYRWFDSGKSVWADGQYDIIATISPADMQAAAEGCYGRLVSVEKTLAAIHAICLETGPRWTADEAVAKITQLVEASDGD